MLITRLQAQGFAGASSLTLRLQRVSLLSGPPRALVAVADALALGFSVLDDATFLPLLARWGLNATLERDATGVVAHWEPAAFLASYLASDTGIAKVHLTLDLDPPLFGRLRKLAGRDPRLVDALSGGSSLGLLVGLRFFPGWDGCSLEMLSVELGNISFPVAGSERPDWLSGFLKALGRRIQRGPCMDAWAKAIRSWDGKQRRALDKALGSLKKRPFSLGDVRLTPDPDRALARLEGDILVPLDRYGPEAISAAGLVGAAFLTGAEVLIWEGGLSKTWLSWLKKQAEAENSVLEQVIVLSEGLAGAEPIPVVEETPVKQRTLKIA
jgi:hypothetical protein